MSWISAHFPVRSRVKPNSEAIFRTMLSISNLEHSNAVLTMSAETVSPWCTTLSRCLRTLSAIVDHKGFPSDSFTVSTSIFQILSSLGNNSRSCAVRLVPIRAERISAHSSDKNAPCKAISPRTPAAKSSTFSRTRITGVERWDLSKTNGRFWR